jgi:hypothetical protein
VQAPGAAVSFCCTFRWLAADFSASYHLPVRKRTVLWSSDFPLCIPERLPGIPEYNARVGYVVLAMFFHNGVDLCFDIVGKENASAVFTRVHFIALVLHLHDPL